jgi:putative membrane protein insertion efficiency factor
LELPATFHNAGTHYLIAMNEGHTLTHSLARLPRLAGHGLILVYRYAISPVIGPRCRHLPSCSEYAEEAIGRFGLWAGGWMALARILRCHPLGTSGLDFVPTELPARAQWWMPWRYARWRGTNANAEGHGSDR